ncbi:MAG TPA: pyrroloquinoline quinone-dependent dehydrogenase [Gemmatimonadaceae bacterium]|nr:pyrroloquinoline quinone-dependent dehydrogenase [Gemmatimonadaceae bacterium]
MNIAPVALVVAALSISVACAPHTMHEVSPASASPGEWSAYGGDVLGGRHSRLTQIDTANVARLAVAWTYHTGELAPTVQTKRPRSLEATPIVVDGVMYLITPLGRVIALDAESGAERWVFDARLDRTIGFGDHTSRGVSTWLDPSRAAGQPCRRRIVAATVDARLLSIDAATGTLCDDFGDHGIVDLRVGLRNTPLETSDYEETSPPVVVNGVIVVGSATADNQATDGASGEVRAFDVRTGAKRWTWDPVPQDSTDPGYATWRGVRAHHTGAANAWSVLAADPARDLVFVPTGSASPDYYGGERLGANRYANSITALRASTGKVVWSFQTVHHDLWDYDNASPPSLVTVQYGGRARDAVLQATKTGQLFVLDRETGVPIVPVEERPVPRSTIAGEEAWPTQPASAIGPLSPQGLVADSVWGANDADRAACRARIAGMRNEGPFTPPSVEGSIVRPSNIGGAHWGGVAFDPTAQIAVVPTNTVAALVRLIARASLDSVRRGAPASRIGAEYAPQRGTPYGMYRELFFLPSLAPCTPPPFGALVGVDLRRGAIVWRVPLGSMPGSGAPTGAPNLGGAITTAGGVTFIGATIDRTFRAFETRTGRELWHATLPASGKATPMTYSAGAAGRQFVAISAGGDGGPFGVSDAIVVYALPQGGR